MLTATEKTGANTYELKISAGAEIFEKELMNQFKKNVKKINVPGFRRGKAPRSIIERMYGENVFFEDAVNALYPTLYSEAVTEAGITPVDNPNVEVHEVSKEGFSFTATVTVKPEVEIKDYKGIKVTKPNTVVTDEDVQKEIDRDLEKNARIITVEDRAAANGDTVIIDYEGFVDDVAFAGGKADKQPLKLGSGQFIPGFEEQIIGHSIGESFDIDVQFPDEYHSEELKGKKAVFKINLHEIKANELPAFDDEFVKDISEFDTVDAYREDKKKKLEEQKAHAGEDEVTGKLIDALHENLTAEIPDCMIDHAADDLVTDFDYRLRGQGMGLELYLQYTGMTKEAFRETFKERAARQVKTNLALEKIAEKEDIKPTAEEIEAEYVRLAGMYGVEADKVRTAIPEAQIVEDMKLNLALKLVKESAEMTEEEVTQDTSDAEKKAKKTTTKSKTTKGKEQE